MSTFDCYVHGIGVRGVFVYRIAHKKWNRHALRRLDNRDTFGDDLNEPGSLP